MTVIGDYKDGHLSSFSEVLKYRYNENYADKNKVWLQKLIKYQFLAPLINNEPVAVKNTMFSPLEAGILFRRI